MCGECLLDIVSTGLLGKHGHPCFLSERLQAGVVLCARVAKHWCPRNGDSQLAAAGFARYDLHMCYGNM